jgi:hypothetical protein
MLLLFAGIGLAEDMQVYVDEPTTIVTACIRNSQMRENVNVTITLFDSNGTMLVTANSTSAGDGTFSYTYIFTQVGSYSTKETCDFGDYLADGSTSINVIKPTFGNVQVIAQGIKETEINKTVRAEWLVLLPNSTNSSQSAVVMTNGSCGVSDINGTSISVDVGEIVKDNILSVNFRSDPAYGFLEDTNYEIICNLTLSQGLMVNGVKNYFYVNPHMSYWQFLGSIFTSVGQILGIVEQTSAKLNATYDISNQTLQIVSNMNLTSTVESVPILMIFRAQTWEDTPVGVMSILRSGSSAIADANCSINIINQQDSQYVVTQGAVANIGNGTYLYNWTSSLDLGYYSIEESCSGGSLDSAVYGSSTAEVVSGSDMYVVG